MREVGYLLFSWGGSFLEPEHGTCRGHYLFSVEILLVLPTISNNLASVSPRKSQARNSQRPPAKIQNGPPTGPVKASHHSQHKSKSTQKKKVKRAHKHKLKTQNSPHITEFQSNSSSARIKSKRRQKCTFLFPMFHEISTSINRVANYHLKLFVQQKVKRLQSMLSENIHEATRSL